MKCPIILQTWDKSILTTTWAYAAGEENIPTAIIEENALDRQSVKIMNSFFQTLAMGNDGNGSVIRIYSFPEQASKQSFLLNTDAEVPANGTIKLGFNLQRKLFAMPPELLVESRAFKKQLWHAFYRDYQRIKIQRGYQ